jgi:hypothetical protein
MPDINQRLHDAARRLAPGVDGKVASSFLPVTGTPGLQAADIVAHSFFEHTKGVLASRDLRPDAPFLDMKSRMPMQQTFVYGEREIIDLVEKLRTQCPEFFVGR